MKMEVVEAFEIRSTVLVILVLLNMLIAWGLWRVGFWCLSRLGLLS
jgi:hypothetical protein